MTRKRTHNRRQPPISYRPPKGRSEELRLRAAASGLSVNAFINACIFGGSRHRPAELQLLARLLDRTARIEDQLHEIALGGTKRHAATIDAAQQGLDEVRCALLKIMGRSP